MSFQESYDNLVFCLKRISGFADFDILREQITNLIAIASEDKKVELEELASTLDTVFVTCHSNIAYSDSSLISEVLAYFDDALENLNDYDLRFYPLTFGKRYYYKEFEEINLINLGFEVKYANIEFENEDDAYSYLLNFLDINHLYQENLLTHELNVKKAFLMIKDNPYRKIKYLLRKYNGEYGEVKEFKKALSDEYYMPYRLAHFENYHEAYKFLQILEPAVVGTAAVEELVNSYHDTIRYYVSNLAYDLKETYLKLNDLEKQEIDKTLKYL